MLLATVLLLLAAIEGYTQDGGISGPQKICPGEQATYYIYYPKHNPGDPPPRYQIASKSSGQEGIQAAPSKGGSGKAVASYSTGMRFIWGTSNGTYYESTVNGFTLKSSERLPVIITAEVYGSGFYYVYRLQVTAGGTAPAAPMVTVTPTIACPGQNVTLSVNSTAVNPRWYDANGSHLPQYEGQKQITLSGVTQAQTLQVAAVNGCSESARIKVTAQVKTLSAPTATGATVCRGSSARLTASGSPSGRYQWYRADLTPIAGATGSEYNTGPLETATDFLVSCFDATCTSLESSRTMVKAEVLPQPTVSITSVPADIKLGKSFSIRISGGSGNSYTVNWGDGSDVVSIGSATTATYAYKKKGTYTIRVEAVNAQQCRAGAEARINVYSVLWENAFPPIGQVKKNQRNGSYVLLDACSREYVLECFSGVGKEQENVVQSAYQAYAYTPVSGTGSNPYQEGQRVLRPVTTFSYNNFGATAPGDNSVAGTFRAAPFNWQADAGLHTGNWTPGSKAVSFSPDGDVLEEVNPLGVKSSAKFGYGNAQGFAKALPYAVAHNAAHKSVLFESFEKVYNKAGVNTFEDDLLLDGKEALLASGAGAHSGTGYLQLNVAGQQARFTTRPFPTADFGQQALIKVWARIGTPALSKQQLGSHSLSVLLKEQNKTLPMTPVAQTGEWILFERAVDIVFDTPALLTPVLVYAGGASVHIDDLRIQPAGAQVTAYVYDARTLKLLTSFDDQHFGLYYQYNDEGQLVRKQIETERGLKTIQETQYNLPKVSQSPSQP